MLKVCAYLDLIFTCCLFIYLQNDLKGSFSVHNIVDISEVEPVDKRYKFS